MTTPYRVGCEDLFVCVGARDSWPPTGLIPWFSKTEGNTYATLLHHPFLFKGKPTQCLRGSKKDFRRRCREDLRQDKTYQVPTINSSPSHYIICHSPLIFLSPTSKTIFEKHCLFFALFRSSLFDCFLCVCVLDCLRDTMAQDNTKLCDFSYIPTTTIFLALRLLLLPILNLAKLMLLC